jgi:hypothetical protein
MAKLSRKVPLEVIFHITVLQPLYSRNYKDLGYSPFARHYWGNHYCFLFLRVLRCFSSPGSLPPDHSGEFPVFNRKGFPIRKSADRKDICSSPQLIAAYHVLHRLWEPRHPPYALNYFLCCTYNLIYKLFQHVKELHQLNNVHKPRTRIIN